MEYAAPYPLMNRQSPISDEELAIQSQRDTQAFDQLIERYEESLMRYVRRLTNVNVQEAEDILQDAFVNAYLHIADFDPELKFSTWIYRIAHNQVISAFRKSSARPDCKDLPLDEEGIEHFIDDIDIPHQTDRKLIAEKVREAIAKLPLHYRAPLELFYFEGKTVQEISDILRKPMGSIATLMRRGKDMCKKHIDWYTLSS